MSNRSRFQIFSYDLDENGNRWLLYFGLGIVGLISYIALTPKPMDSDLIGVWKLESTQTNGMPPYRERTLWVISQDGLQIVNDDQATQVGFSVDTSFYPRRMDIDFEFQPYGIYEVDGDTVRLSKQVIESTRPAAAGC